MANDMERWLDRVGLAQYGKLFAENAVELEVLPELTEQDLKDLNIPLGHRKKLLKAIAELSASPIGQAAKTAPTLQPRNEAERRQLTVLFCDLVDSTALSSRLDPEEMREVIRVYQTACAKVVARHGGYLAKFMGDGVLVYFGYPQAYGNDAERAAHAGLGIVQSIADLGDARAELGDIDLAVRIGIDTGLVVVGDIIGEGAAEERSVVGETPNIAARLQSVAAPNQIVIGPLTHQLIGNRFVCEDLGGKQVKGITDPVHAWRVLHESEDDSDADLPAAVGASPLVGRQEEYGLLLRSWEASKKGHGQTVLIKGEPGLGKSRLVAAMRERAAADKHVWLSIRCSAHHANSTLYPVIEHLRRALGWRADDDDAARLDKLERALQRQSMPADTAVPLFADVLSLPLPAGRYAALSLTPQERREQTLDALVGWLTAEVERSPVLLVWEDLHWADPSTLELMHLCLEQSRTLAMMNVLTYRSDFSPPWTMRSDMTPITLNRLDRGEVEALIEQRRAGRPLSPDIVDYIVEKADGVPLYVEELTKAMLEANYSGPDSENRVGRPRSAMEVPATLQELLMARLDRLPTIREIAQVGSILGREFAYEMLQAICAFGEAELQSGLDRLVDAELLYQRGRRPRARYIFKHALVQDAAYQSLLKRTRQYYHQQVAELLEQRYPDLVRTQPELVAHHYAQAANHAKAVHYLASYSEKAAASYAHAEAIAALETARFHAERLPQPECSVQVVGLIVRQAQSLHFLGRRQEIVELLSRHGDRLDALGDAALVAEYHFWLGFAHGWLGNRAEAAANLGRGLEEATRAGSATIKGRVLRALATECVYSGRPLGEAVAYARQATTALEGTDDRFWLSQALFTLSYCCIFAGDFESALQAAGRLEAFGDTTGRSRAQANAAMLAGLSRAMRGEGEASVALCERALAASPDTFETAFVLACLGRSRWEAGDKPGAVAALEQAVELADRVRSLQFRAWFRTMLAEAYLLNGELEKSEVVVQQALAASAGSEFQIGVGLSRQLLGRVARAKGALDEAQRQLDAALAVLAAAGARFEVARTRLEMAFVAHELQQEAAAAGHLKDAAEEFARLNIPKHVELTRGLALSWGIGLVSAPPA